MFAGIFFQQNHPGEDFICTLLNNGNLLFEGIAHTDSVLGNLITNVEKFVFLLFEEHSESRSLVVEGLNNVGNIADSAFCNMIKQGILVFKRSCQLLHGRIGRFGRLVESFGLTVENTVYLMSAFGNRFAQGFHILRLADQNVLQLGNFSQRFIGIGVKLGCLFGKIIINRFALGNDVITGGNHNIQLFFESFHG